MLVGREPELGRVVAGVGERGLVLVTAGAGFGKTALVRAAATALAAGGAVRTGQALPALAAEAYAPVLHAVGMPRSSQEPGDVARQVLERLEDGDVLVLEDLHWADHGTLEVLAELAGSVPTIATVRAGDPGAAAVEALAGLLDAEVVELGPLPVDALERVVEQRRPSLYPGERQRLAEASAGVPLLAELLADLGDLPPAAAAGGPTGAVLSAIVGGLSDAARQGLVLLAEAPRAIEPELVDGGAELLSAGLVERDGDGRLSLVHSLYGEAARSFVRPEDLARARLRLAGAPASSGVTRARLLLDGGDPRGALDAALAAIDGPSSRAEQAAALGLAARAAREVAASDAGSTVEVDATGLRLRAAIALNDEMDHAAALDLVDELDDFDGRERIQAAIELLRAGVGGGDRSVAADVIDRAEAVLAGAEGPDADHCRFFVEMLRRWSSDPSVEVGLDEIAERQMAVATDGRERSRAAQLRGIALVNPIVATSAQEAAAWFERARTEGRRSGELGSELEAARNLVMVQSAVGRREEAEALAREYAERARLAGADAWVIEFRTYEHVLLLDDPDRRDEALSWMSYARNAPARLETRMAATVALATCLADGGDAVRSAAVLRPWTDGDRLIGCPPLVQGTILWGVAQRAWILGELDAAIAAGRRSVELLPAGFPSTAGTHVVWRWAEFEAGVELCAPDPLGGSQPAAALEATAIRDLADGRPRAAAAGFLEAADSWRPLLRRCELRSRWGAGLALARAGDDRAAAELLTDLDGELDRWGVPALRPRVQATLRSLGASARAGAATGVRRGSGPVTVAERSVLELVGQGLRTDGIARRLGVTPDTVNSHVRSAVRKLGARNRTDAAERLAWLDAGGPPD